MEIKALIDKAEILKNKKEDRTNIKIEIYRFKKLGFNDPYVILERPTLTTVIAAQEHKSEYYQLCESMKTPDLSNKDLLKAFNVNNKTALLKKIFTDEEIQEMVLHLGKIVLETRKTKIIADIKNS
ncbi:hypothetical protein [Fusobacterium ulcerans]|uniref:hypothetical protein n=1 Tax=Fusobacterium ulcerans TaxID=861 RepID=UPI00241FFCBA|nr:hypothetical protein [Fusobacterium ulcerans]